MIGYIGIAMGITVLCALFALFAFFAWCLTDAGGNADDARDAMRDREERR